MTEEQAFDYEKELARLMRTISKSAKTEAEVRKRLATKTEKLEIIESIISKLTKFTFIDDQRYAHEFVRAKTSIGHGQHRIRHKLLEKGCPESFIDKALDEQEKERSQAAVLTEVVKRRIRTKGEPSNPKELKSLFDFCVRRGFDYALVQNQLQPWFDRLMRE